MNQDKSVRCFFCETKKTENNQQIFIALNDEAVICETCVDLCKSMIDEQHLIDSRNPGPQSEPKPKDVFDYLQKHVINQDSAKKTLSVAIYNHAKRINLKNSRLSKSNILMVGPTGSGKTLMAEKLAELMDVPFAIVDATSLTEAGYVGEDVETIVKRLLIKAENNVEKAEKGIIFIDEIDKIASKTASSSTTNEVGSQGVQQALLKIIEGAEVNVQIDGGRRISDKPSITINTKNILFICSGAFAGIEKIMNKNQKPSIGFSREKIESKSLTEKMGDVEQEDLIKYGMIPEFVGRLPVIVTLEELDETALCKILTEPDHSIISQFQKLLETDGIELIFEECALKAIAQEAIRRKIGARGLRSIVESTMRDIMFEAPSMAGLKQIIINEEAIKSKKVTNLVFEEIAA